MPDCPFCERIKAGEYDGVDAQTVVFEPLNPVTPGHLLVVPKLHVRDATIDLHITARTMYCAALVASGFDAANIITSIGADASQTVRHLHLHVVPRKAGDGLALPWTGQGQEVPDA